MSLRTRFFGPKRPRIDPFTVGEPWRRLVQDALAADSQFRDAVGRGRQGPVHDRLTDIGLRVSDGVVECWRVAQAGHSLSKARARIDLAQLRREHAALPTALTDGTDSPSSATAAALQAQIDAANRMDATIAETRDHLRLLNARLDEVVTRAIELSVSTSTDDQLSSVSADLVDITNEVEALRQGLEAVEGLGPSTQ